MNNRISIKIEQLKFIIEIAERHQLDHGDASDVIVLEKVENAKWHNGSDSVKVFLESRFGECDDHFITSNY